MRIYRDLDIVESLGSGIPRILRAYGEDCFHFTDNFIRITFPASVQVDHASATENATEITTENTTEKTTEKILTTITTNPYITQSELAKVCGITEDGVYWNIKKLKEGGIIRRVGPDKGGHW